MMSRAAQGSQTPLFGPDNRLLYFPIAIIRTRLFAKSSSVTAVGLALGLRLSSPYWLAILYTPKPNCRTPRVNEEAGRLARSRQQEYVFGCARKAKTGVVNVPQCGPLGGIR